MQASINMKQAPVATAAVLIAAICIIGVIAIIQSITDSDGPNKPDYVGICVHNLITEDAQLISQSGARWIRIDISNNETDMNNSLANAKNYNLSVLGILGSWMFDKSCSFTLDQWSSAVSTNVSKYASSVDAWEIWNEPASTQEGWQLQPDYFLMVKIASPIIRQNDPTAKIVLLGGLQLYNSSPNVPTEDKFMPIHGAIRRHQFGKTSTMLP